MTLASSACRVESINPAQRMFFSSSFAALTIRCKSAFRYLTSGAVSAVTVDSSAGHNPRRSPTECSPPATGRPGSSAILEQLSGGADAPYFARRLPPAKPTVIASTSPALLLVENDG